MRRADRLFQIVLFLRHRRISTACDLTGEPFADEAGKRLEDFLPTLPRGGRDFGGPGA